MKVFDRLMFDHVTGEVWTETRNYNCKGDVQVPAYQETDTQKATNEAYLKLINTQQARLDNPEAYYTPLEKMLNTVGTTELQNYIENLPEQQAYQEKQMAYMSELIDYNTQQLQNVKTVQELSEYTGELTTDEKSMLDQIASNSISQITSTVNEETQDIVSSKIADLVGKGVLDSTVGTQLLAKVAESAQEAIAKGTTDIETARLQQELSIQQSNKDRALNWANYGLNKEQIYSQLGSQNLSALQSPLTSGTQISQYASGLQNQWGNSASNSLSSLMSNLTSQSNTQYQGALNAAIQTAQNEAGIAGSQWGAFGTAAGLGAGAAIAMSDKKLKDNIKNITDPIDKILAINGTTYCLKENGEKDVGVIAQEIEEIMPEAVTDIDGTKAVYYYKLIPLLIEGMKAQQRQIQALTEAQSNG